MSFYRHEFFFTPSPLSNLYIALAHSRNYGLPALPRAFFVCGLLTTAPLKLLKTMKVGRQAYYFVTL